MRFELYNEFDELLTLSSHVSAIVPNFKVKDTIRIYEGDVLLDTIKSEKELSKYLGDKK